MYLQDDAPYSIGWTVDRRGYDDFYIVDKNHKPIGGPRTLSSAKQELENIANSGIPVLQVEEGRERRIPELWAK